MGKAYGTPVPTTLDGPQILAAERQATDKLDRTYHGCPPDVLWRVEAVSYSQCVDPDADRYESSPPRLELFALPVHKWTPHGATLEEWTGARRRWVRLDDDGKQYASRTPADALEQFRRRRVAQINILQAQLARAERELALCNPMRAPQGPLA